MDAITSPGYVGAAHAWTDEHGAHIVAVKGHLVDLMGLEYDAQAPCLATLELFRSKLAEAFCIVWGKPVGIAFDVELSGTQGGHRRKAPSDDSRPQDKPGFDRLHHVAQLWVDYLTARTEPLKQAILYEAAANLQHLHRYGDEGEEVIALIENAIRERGQVYGATNSRKVWATVADGSFALWVERVNG